MHSYDKALMLGLFVMLLLQSNKFIIFIPMIQQAISKHCLTAEQ